ncbi:SDR family NAD(P)-dependent oxidoreductase [Pseudonocardia sp. TRM90224]|uniref:SDR family NAD(P)-dependent oxidoreductase n=1 Tax=Pseudonocardia sp. TRM90224 TaxID=2812678 RepID=UPI001E4A8C43|nr:SDR family oxidoreductase [Pseudonocardia sp. TRM90224]
MDQRRSYVVTGGARGVGRAIVERLLDEGAHVVAIDLDGPALAGSRAEVVAGSAADEGVARRAAELAEAGAPLAGWVNNAAVFGDASLHTASPVDVLEMVDRNLAPALVGCSVAIRHLLTAERAGSIVNVSSHQATRAVPGCTPYVTAKAAIEGLTRALAVEYGARGIRVNAVALGSIRTERYDALLAELGPEAAARVEDEMRRLHPLGRVGEAHEVAATVAHLLSSDSSFVTGTTIPIDGGRVVLAGDPEAHEV